MKRILPIVIILYSNTVEGQTSKAHTSYFGCALEIGGNYVKATTDQLGKWATSTGQTLPCEGPTGNVGLTFYGHYFDVGFDLVIPNPYFVEYFFGGLRLTRYKSKFASFLNFCGGMLTAQYNDLHPINYTLTPDQVGKDMDLHYSNWFIGLANKTHWIHHITPHRYVSLGVNVLMGYTIGKGNWQYGYYVQEGKYSHFNSVRVYGIPDLGSLFCSVGLVFGFGGQ